MVIYVVVQLAFIAALPSDTFAHGWSTTAFIGDKGPYAGLLALVGFTWFVKLLYVDACVSPYGTALAQSLSTSRITYGMCENGYFPAFLMKTTKNGTPLRALLFNLILGLLFFLPLPSWQHMVDFLVSCLVIGYVVGPMALMVLVRQQPELFSRIPTIVIHSLCLIAFTICNLLIFWSGWSTVYKIMILFVMGYGLLALTQLQLKKSTERKKLHMTRGSWVFLYLPGMTMISYFSSFGGDNVIPFGIDFGVMGLFSTVIYAIAWKLTSKSFLL